MKEFIWKGPSGSNPSLGWLVHGEPVKVPEGMAKKLLSEDLIEEAKLKKPTTKKRYNNGKWIWNGRTSCR